MILKKYEIEQDDYTTTIKFYYNENDLTFDVLVYVIDLCVPYDYHYSKVDGEFTIKLSGYDKNYNRIRYEIDHDLINELYKNPTKCFMYHDDKNPVLDIFSKVMVKCFEPT